MPGNQRAVMDPTKQVTALNTTEARGGGSPFVLADVTKLVAQRFCVFPLLWQYESNAEVTFLRESSVSIAAFYRCETDDRTRAL